MKVGDLVKHPEGMISVCPTTYSLGVVLEVGDYFYGQGTLVAWLLGDTGMYMYPSIQLEVIYEGR